MMNKPLKFIKYLRKSSVLIFLILTSFSVLQAQPAKWKSKKYMTVVSYNLENLFDTVNSDGINDVEYTPDSDKKYNTAKYNLKLSNLAKVIASFNTQEFPEIIGVVEVENRNVLEDLVLQPQIKDANYQVVHEQGPDPRGIDCGLIYRPDVFKYLNHRALEVRFPFARNQRTRDILYVKGLIHKDTLHIFVNHWSSRLGGEENSEPKRNHCAIVLKQHIDSLKALNANAQILILGDFNDTPVNESLKVTLAADKPGSDAQLINLSYELCEQKKGSYYYRGDYDMLDNIIVSKNLTSKTKGLRLYENTSWIYMPDFLTYTQKNGDKAPNRSFGGNTFYGGYSDHFPVYTIFYEK